MDFDLDVVYKYPESTPHYLCCLYLGICDIILLFQQVNSSLQQVNFEFRSAYLIFVF